VLEVAALYKTEDTPSGMKGEPVQKGERKTSQWGSGKGKKNVGKGVAPLERRGRREISRLDERLKCDRQSTR